MRSILVPMLCAAWCGAALANTPPATPTVTEPRVGRIVNPADLHMECSEFADADAGDTHACSDWEVWTVTPPERVWATLCIGGVERIHTHLGDGSFMGSHAGRTELLPNTAYTLRVRHRDSSGQAATEWSGWGERAFVTGPASQVFPFETEDIAESPVPLWAEVSGAPILLPGAASPPSLRLESADGERLLEVRGTGGASNVVINPAPLAEHVPVRVRISAGTLGGTLALPESDLTVTTHDGAAVTIYLPAVSVPAGADRFFWVSTAGSTYHGQAGQTAPDFSTLARGSPVPWAPRQPGYRVEIVARGFQLPVNIAFVPNPGPDPGSPMYYVTELYGAIKVVTRDGTVSDYATGLLNFNPTGNFPGSGEQGVTGIAVDPANGDVYAGMLYSSQNGVENVPHYPKVVRFTSSDGGLTAATQTTILNMTGETQGQSHQISNLTFGPDGLLYVHMGDGFSTATAQNLASYRGKILRLNRNGTPAPTNPFYNAGDGITARDYVYAYGVRNPFGGAWRDEDGAHYEVENGPSVDRIAKVVAGRNYLWDGSDASMANFAIYAWNPASGPVNMAFIQASTFGGSGYPPGKQGHMFISESGPTWATGPQSLGKRISEFVLDASGNLVSGPTPLVEYVGAGKATCVALAAGPDGLYFSDLYKDLDYASPIDRGANILRVRFVGDADFTADVTSGPAPLTVQFTDTSTVPGAASWSWDFGDGATSTLRHPAHTFAHNGLYTVRLAVTGDAGLSVQQKAAFIRVGTLPRVAIIGVSIPPAPADGAIAGFLSAAGYAVTVYDDEPANRPSAAQIAASHDLVLVSSTITSANVAGQFRTLPIPVVFWENALLRSARESLTDNGNVVSATTIDVIDATHPITQGLPASAPVFGAPSNMSVGTGNTGPGTRILARRGGSTDIALMTAEAGATVAGGYVTPARRVFLFLEDSSWLNATLDAENILDRSVCWAMGRSAPEIGQHPSGGTVCEGDAVTLTVGATGPAPLYVRWRRDGVLIPGAFGPDLTLDPASPGDSGAYDAVVSNSCGTVSSNPALLVVEACCIADFNRSGGTPDDADVAAFFAAWNAGEEPADVNRSGGTPDDADVAYFFLRWNEGC